MFDIKKTTVNIALALTTVFLTLFVLEIGTRIFFPAKRPRLIVKKETPLNAKKEFRFLKPFYEATLLSSEFEMEIKLNSDGFRDVEHETNKPAGVFRILVVGDSFTYGIGVRADQTYPKMLEKILNERKRNQDITYEVFNMGIPDIGTFEEMEIIRLGMKYKPDLILLGALIENRWARRGNDLCDNFRYWNKLQTEEKMTIKEERESPAPMRSYLINCFNFFHRFLRDHSELYYFIMTKQGNSLRRNLMGLRKDKDHDKLSLGWEITKEAFEETKDFVTQRDLPFVIIHIPFLYDVLNESNETKEILGEFSKENDINLCFLSDALRSYKEKDLLYYQADGHFQALAHNLAAEAIADYLIKKMILRDRPHET